MSLSYNVECYRKDLYDKVILALYLDFSSFSSRFAIDAKKF
jgi:hypothetical protein